MVVGLIEKTAGLAVGEQVSLQAVFAQPVDHLGRTFAGGDFAHARQAFEVARRSVVARHDHAYAQEFLQQAGQRGASRVHGHGRGLYDRSIGIAVDEETGQAVRFAVNQAQSIAIESELLAPGERGREAFGHQSHQLRQGSAVASPLQDAQSNRGQDGPGRAGQRPSLFVEHSHQRRSTGARIGRRPGEHILAKDPGMPGRDAGAAACIHDYGSYGWFAHDETTRSLA